MQSAQSRETPATAADPAAAPSIGEAAAALEAGVRGVRRVERPAEAPLLSFAEALPALDAAQKNGGEPVLGCQSRVWLVACPDPATGRLHLAADSDAKIMRGLLGPGAAALFRPDSGGKSRRIRRPSSDSLSFGRQLVPARASGLTRIVERIQAAAAEPEDRDR